MRFAFDMFFFLSVCTFFGSGVLWKSKWLSINFCRLWLQYT